MKLHQTAWKLHRYLSYLVFAQVFFWVVGGALFATVPFQSLVKGGDYAAPPPAAQLPTHWQALLPEPDFGLQAVRAHASAQGPVLELVGQADSRWLDAQGRPLASATQADIGRYARSLYRGQGELESVAFVDQAQPRMLGLVEELGDRRDLWLASFDAGRTRLYFTDTGRYLTVRTDYWVWYDALWRLHIMDYGQGEDFNNSLLRVFAWLALAFVVTGLVLSFYAARRQLHHQLPRGRRRA